MTPFAQSHQRKALDVVVWKRQFIEEPQNDQPLANGEISKNAQVFDSFDVSVNAQVLDPFAVFENAQVHDSLAVSVNDKSLQRPLNMPSSLTLPASMATMAFSSPTVSLIPCLSVP